MIRYRSLATMAVTLALTAGASITAGATLAASPITLRLASPDSTGRPSEEPIRFFVDEVARRSGGTITIEPVFDVTSVGPDEPLQFEQYAAAEVAAGHYDLGVVASRGFDKTDSLTQLALQAPFLIDNDALAIAVARDPVADAILEGMAPAGVTGLSLWPEDLRHPFAFATFGRPFLSPEDFQGTTIRLIPSTVGFALVEALGATPMFADGYGRDVILGRIQGAESGLRQGASLPDYPTATGNVTFYPKMETLVASTATWDQLTDEQRTILRDAAIATRDHAIEERPTDVQAGQAWCDDAQGRVAVASEAQVAAFQEAAAPVFATLEADPGVKVIIDSIRDLKARTPASPSAAACEPAPRPTPPTDVDRTAATLPPDGTFRATITEQDLLDTGWSSIDAANWAGTWFITLEGGTMTLHYDGDSPDNDCHFPYQVVDNVVRVTLGDCWDESSIDLQWSIGDDGALRLVVVDVDPVQYYADDSSWFGRDWIPVG